MLADGFVVYRANSFPELTPETLNLHCDMLVQASGIRPKLVSTDATIHYITNSNRAFHLLRRWKLPNRLSVGTVRAYDVIEFKMRLWYE